MAEDLELRTTGPRREGTWGQLVSGVPRTRMKRTRGKFSINLAMEHIIIVIMKYPKADAHAGLARGGEALMVP